MTATTATEIQTLPLAFIRRGDNDRTTFNESELRELADSIAEDGQLQPIVVRPVGSLYEIVAGERRARAVMLLGRDHIEAIVRPMDDAQASRAMLAENVKRVDLNLVDEARGYAKRMEQFGLTAEQVAEWAHVSTARVATRLPILKLVQEAQELVRLGELSINHAKVLAPLDANRQIIALRILNTTDLTYFEFRDTCDKLAGEQAQESFDMNDFWTVETLDAIRNGRKRPDMKKLVGLLCDALERTDTDSDLVAAARAAITTKKE